MRCCDFNETGARPAVGNRGGGGRGTRLGAIIGPLDFHFAATFENLNTRKATTALVVGPRRTFCPDPSGVTKSGRRRACSLLAS